MKLYASDTEGGYLFHEPMLSEKESICPLTVMNYIDRSARSENGERVGVIAASGICRAVLDLEAETEGMSTCLC